MNLRILMLTLGNLEAASYSIRQVDLDPLPEKIGRRHKAQLEKADKIIRNIREEIRQSLTEEKL